VDIHGSKQGLMVVISPSLTQSHIASILQHGNTSQATTDLIFSILWCYRGAHNDQRFRSHWHNFCSSFTLFFETASHVKILKTCSHRWLV